ncbi:MAG: hypothetical protein VX184_03915 [Candidatus Thermoplasmatota archaeon]|nr:hypothetical protein [Candidatus Thermoplasmatota archaeon]
MGARTPRGLGDHCTVGGILVGLAQLVVAILKDDAPEPIVINSGVAKSEGKEWSQLQGSGSDGESRVPNDVPDSDDAREGLDLVRLFFTLLLSSLVTSGVIILVIILVISFLASILINIWYGTEFTLLGVVSYAFSDVLGGWAFDWIILPCLVVFMLPYLIISVYWKMHEQGNQ